MMAGCVVALATAAAALRRSRDHALARRLDETGATGGQILSGYDLLGVVERGVAEMAGLSIGLARWRSIARRAWPPRFPARGPCPPDGSPRLLVGRRGGAAMGLVHSWRRGWRAPNGSASPTPSAIIPLTRAPCSTSRPAIPKYSMAQLDVLVTTEGPVAIRSKSSCCRRDDGAKCFRRRAMRFFLRRAVRTTDAAHVSRAGARGAPKSPSCTRTVRYFARAQGARSQRFQIAVVTVPQLENVKWRITPPAYTATRCTKDRCRRRGWPEYAARRCKSWPKATGRWRRAPRAGAGR